MSTRKQWHDEWRDWSDENADLCAGYGFPALVSGRSTAEEDAGVASMTLLRDEHFSRVQGTTCAMLAGGIAVAVPTGRCCSITRPRVH